MNEADALPASGAPAAAAPDFFSLSDRIGRLRYFVYILCGMLGSSLLLVAIYLLALLLPTPLGNLVSVSSLILVNQILMPLIIFVMSIRRLHDLDFNGWWALMILIPFATLVLLVLPGQRVANRFGPPPAPNPGSLSATAIILPTALLALYLGMAGIETGVDPVAPATGSGGKHPPLRGYEEK